VGPEWVFIKNAVFSLCQTAFFNLTNVALNPIQLEHFRNLVSLSAIDGKIEEIERIALAKIAYEQGLPLERLNLMLNRASEYIYLIPQNTEEKEKQLEEMIKLALVDDDFAPAERELIEIVSDRLGFSRKDLDVILETHCGQKK
jgi:uncharacterized tellurite resistance protein B-like protein